VVGVAGGQGVVAAAILGHGDELLEGLAHLLLHVDAVVLQRVSMRRANVRNLGHGTGEREVREVAAHADTHGEGGQAQRGQIEVAALGEALNALQAPVVDVLAVGGDLVVVGKHLIDVSMPYTPGTNLAEEGLEAIVIAGLHGIAAHAGVGVLNAAAAALDQPLLLVVRQGVEVGEVKVLPGGVRRIERQTYAMRFSGYSFLIKKIRPIASANGPVSTVLRSSDSFFEKLIPPLVAEFPINACTHETKRDKVFTNWRSQNEM
jgi:hypothetical protein